LIYYRIVRKRDLKKSPKESYDKVTTNRCSFFHKKKKSFTNLKSYNNYVSRNFAWVLGESLRLFLNSTLTADRCAFQVPIQSEARLFVRSRNETRLKSKNFQILNEVKTFCCFHPVIVFRSNRIRSEYTRQNDRMEIFLESEIYYDIFCVQTAQSKSFSMFVAA